MKNPSKFSLDELASQGEGFEDISPDEAEELAGGHELNVSCGSGNNKGCPISNTGCGPKAAEVAE